MPFMNKMDCHFRSRLICWSFVFRFIIIGNTYGDMAAIDIRNGEHYFSENESYNIEKAYNVNEPN